MKYQPNLRLLFLFVACNLCLNVHAGAKKIKMSFDFYAVEAYTKGLSEGITIGIYAVNGQLLLEGKSDSKGRFSPIIELDQQEHEIRVSDDFDRFESFTYSFIPTKKRSHHSMELSLYPSKRILSEWIAREDSIYGSIVTKTKKRKR